MLGTLEVSCEGVSPVMHLWLVLRDNAIPLAGFAPFITATPSEAFTSEALCDCERRQSSLSCPCSAAQ